jgi:hypothetical protein
MQDNIIQEILGRTSDTSSKASFGTEKQAEIIN